MNNTPNLDGMSQRELGAFWATWCRATKRRAVELVGVRKDAAKVAHILANYAINSHGLPREGRHPDGSQVRGRLRTSLRSPSGGLSVVRALLFALILPACGGAVQPEPVSDPNELPRLN